MTHKTFAAAGFGTFEEIRNKKIFTLNGQLSSTVINCHQLDDSSKPNNSKDFSFNCHQMTKTYISENFDFRAELSSDDLTDELDVNLVKSSQNLEDIQFCHLMTVEAQSLAPQRIEVDDSLMTVDDSDDSSTLNEDETELLEFLHRAAGAGFYKIGARALLKCPKQNFRQKSGTRKTECH